MIKKIALIVLFMFAIFALYIFVKNNLSIKETTTEPQSEKPIIHFMVEVVDEDVRIPLDDLVEKYNEASNATIKLDKISYEKYQYILNMKMLSGNPPDIFILQEDWIQTYKEKEWLYSISNELKINANINDAYAVPLSRDTYQLVYRRDIFEDVGLDPNSPPRNLTELYNQALVINDMKVGAAYGFILYFKNTESDFIDLIENLHKTKGIYYYDSNERVYNFNIYQDWLQTIVDIKNNSTMRENLMEIKKNIVLNQFREGAIGMTIISSSDYYWIQGQNDPNIGISSLPLSNQDTVFALPNNYIGVHSETKQISEVIKFCNALTSKEWGKKLYSDGYFIPLQNITIDEMEKTESALPKNFLPTDDSITYYETSKNTGDVYVRFNIYEQIIKDEIAVNEGLQNITDLFNEIMN